MNMTTYQGTYQDWLTSPYCWIGIVLVLFIIFALLKLLAFNRVTKSSFKELNNKIDNLYRTTDAFKELNSKIDNLNRNTEELKKNTIEN